jgi:hypothetical protein
MDDSRFSKLPKWAQDYIKRIERERDVAIRQLNASLDSQTPSAFYFEGRVCTGEDSGPTLKRHYVQTHKITVAYQGVVLEVCTRANEDGIDLQWNPGDSEREYSGDVAFIPSSRQQARLVSKDNMR